MLNSNIAPLIFRAYIKMKHIRNFHTPLYMGIEVKMIFLNH